MTTGTYFAYNINIKEAVTHEVTVFLCVYTTDGVKNFGISLIVR